jgi:hypothetical protein
MKRSIITIVCLIGMGMSLRAQVVINEFSASNLNQFVDNHSDYEDWIELYNTSSTAVSLAGYYLSDDTLNNTKWQFPAGITISGNGFLRVWASGRNEVAPPHYHTNFKLKQTKNLGEYVVLSNPSGVIIDYKKCKITQLGHSYGRTLNGSSSWSIFTTPTPNASNNTSTPYDDYAKKPQFSLAAGFYSGPVTVAITTNEPNADIRYTLDGTLPTITSPIYTTPITISSTKVLKARVFTTNPTILPSFINFATYFIAETHTVPVVSISGNQLTSLANGNGSLKPHGTFEYFDLDGVRKASTYGEFNRHGQDSWANAHRSLDFVSRDEMGYNHAVEHQLFHTSPRDNYQRVMLRAAGDDNYPTNVNWTSSAAHMRDAFLHNLALSGNLRLDVRRGAKCAVYLNGTYWGLYDLRDNPDDHDNTKYYYGQDKYHLYFILTWGNTWAEYGGQAALNEYTNLVNFILSNNMANPANYQYVYDRLEVESLVDYVLVNMFSVCKDWLNWNTGWWRGLDSSGTHLKWGYILWDNDATWGHYINYTGIPNTGPSAPPCDVETLTNFNSFYKDSHIKVLNKLRTNPTFNQYYITRQHDLWNTTFSCDNMLAQLDSTANLMSIEMQRQIQRWGGTYNQWWNNYQSLRNFIISRCSLLINGWINCYQINGPYEVTLMTDPAGVADLKLNSLTLNASQLPFTGRYFGGIETNLDVMPYPNHQFVSWSANTQTFQPNNTTTNAQVMLNASDTLIAHFLTVSAGAAPGLLLPTISVYPTLMKHETLIDYYLPKASPVSLSLFSINGQKVMEIIPPAEMMQAGNHTIAMDISRTSLTAGVYVLHFKAGDYHKAIRLVYAPER